VALYPSNEVDDNRKTYVIWHTIKMAVVLSALLISVRLAVAVPLG
jgi:hypothetical protein